MSLEDLVKASQRMTEKDFPQFPDPRVREVMAAASEMVEMLCRDRSSEELLRGRDRLSMALFAAQHSKPKETPEHFEARVLDAIAGYPSLDKPRTHEKPIKFDQWGYGMAETNQFLVDGSKPGGKAFIAAVEETQPPFGVGCTKCLRDGPENCRNHRVGKP